MAYRINYDSGGKHRIPIRRYFTAATVKTGLIILVLVAAALTIKFYGLNWVKEVLLPGDPKVTETALHNMTEGLQNGESILEAVTTFCQEIVNSAQ